MPTWIHRLFAGLLLITFSLMVTAHPTDAQLDPLSDGVAQYHAGNYGQAVTLLQRVIEDPDTSGADMLRAYKFLAYAHFHLDQILSAEEAARSLYVLDPSFDPDENDAALRTFFAQVQKDMLNTVRVTSDPEGAVVYMDDREIGVTPTIVEDVEPGLHYFKFKKNGYQDLEKPIYIEPATINRVEVNLESARSKKWIWYIVGPVILGGAIATGLALTGDDGGSDLNLLGEPPDPPQ